MVNNEKMKTSQQQTEQFLLLPHDGHRHVHKQRCRRGARECTPARCGVGVVVTVLAIPAFIALLLLFGLGTLLLLISPGPSSGSADPGSAVIAILLLVCMAVVALWRLAYNFACPTDPCFLDGKCLEDGAC